MRPNVPSPSAMPVRRPRLFAMFYAAVVLGAVALFGVAYFIVNSTLVSTVIGLTNGPNPWRIWQWNFQSGLLHHLSFIALGTLVAVTYFGTGPWGLVLFAIPFMVARQAFRLYMEIRS